MRTNDIKALHTKTVEELALLGKEKTEALFKALMEQSQSKLKNVRSISQLRDDIARIKTVQKVKEKQNNG